MSRHFQDTDSGRLYHVPNPRAVEFRKGDRVALQGTIVAFGTRIISVMLDGGTIAHVDVRDVIGGHPLRKVTLPEHEPFAPAEIDAPEMDGV